MQDALRTRSENTPESGGFNGNSLLQDFQDINIQRKGPSGLFLYTREILTAKHIQNNFVLMRQRH